MSGKTVCICAVDEPFVRGGAEIQLDSLARELEKRGHEVARVTLPFVWYPVRDLMRNTLMWRWIDLERATHRSIDRVICTKFPSYGVRHPRKVTWLIHQFRQAYELHGTPYSDFHGGVEDEAVRRAIQGFDRRMLAESEAIFTESGRVAQRLEHYLGMQGEPLYHPPLHWDEHYHERYGDYMLSVGRLVPLKRVDLLLHALARPGIGLRAVIAGDGPERRALEDLAAELGLAGRVDFVGAKWGRELVDLYAGARAVYFAPFDEDYGLITTEAFRSRKPVLTTKDAGGPLEFVRHGQTGWVVEPVAEAIAEAVAEAEDDTARCAQLGEAGYEAVSFISWDHVVERLLDGA